MPRPKIALISLSLVSIFSLIGVKTWLQATTFSHQTPTLASAGYDQSDTQGEYYGHIVTSTDVVTSLPKLPVLSHSTAQKRIEVNLTAQRVYAYEDDRLIYDFLVSTGKWGRTPTGTFTIWAKSRYQKMSGGSKVLGTYYYLPNVPYISWFSNSEVPAIRGYSFHGTYWHDNFGHPMSHGCINMRTEDAEKLFYWADPEVGDHNFVKATPENQGTQVVIYGTTPKS